MTTILPLGKVVHIINTRQERLGYGLEVSPAPGKPAQHWLLFANHPPARTPTEPRMLPELTTWQQTDDDDWREATTPDKFLVLVHRELENRRDDAIYATAHFSTTIRQPDVGGFWLFQQGHTVGRGGVSYDHPTNVYQETWTLGPGFKNTTAFGFEQTAVGIRPPRVKPLADPPGYRTTVLLDLRYYKNLIAAGATA